WVAVVVTLLSLLVIAESWLGHFRSGFPLRAQYTPLAIGGLLAVSGISAAIAPAAPWTHVGLRIAGVAAVITGVIGVGYHHWYGIVEKAGGYRWLLHYLMYGAPQLAPLSLSVVGALAFVDAHALGGQDALWGTSISGSFLGIVTVGLAGAIAQAGILHYRGAFNTPLMYVPLMIPPLAVLAGAWMWASPGTASHLAMRVSLWLTLLTGFVGLGMHLRGVDRQMGGLHVPLVNLLQGPPPLAPAVFAGLSAVGLASLELAR
ncbi:MAG TPA: hypothetical protein VJ596_06110, partial [Gemmatimonadaceae bacterium]|nr:hypothetical protein [Gemmatimonadaceae bacterium]